MSSAMEPLELHYSRYKLIRLALLSLVMTVVGLWIAAGGISEETGRRGPGAWIGRLLGPDGLQILGGVVAAAAALFALLYLRRAFADPVAARADVAGLTINTVLGSHSYAAEDIAGLELQFPAGQPILQVIPRVGQGKMRGLAVNGLNQDVQAVQAWIEAVAERQERYLTGEA
jgi:hypothetical protein